MRKSAMFMAVLAIIIVISGCASLSVSSDKIHPSSQLNTETEPTNTEQPSFSPKSIESPPASVSYDPDKLYMSYLSFVRVLNKGLDNINAKTKNNKDLSHVDKVAQDTMGCMVSVMALTALGGKKGLPTLKAVGYSDIETSQKDGSYIINFKDPDGIECEQTCDYYPSNDSLQSVIRDKEGKITMFFEYVNTGEGYAMQAYEYEADESGYMRFRSFFDNSGTISAGIFPFKQPVSMLSDSGFDINYVNDSYMYFVLKGTALTVIEDGKTNKY